MRLALSSHLSVQHRLSIAWLEKVLASGINVVELFCAKQHLDWLNKEQIQELATWFRDSPMELHSLHSPMFTDDVWGRSGPSAVINICELEKPKRIKWVDETKRALEIAESIPCRYLIQHVGGPAEEWDPRKIDSAFDSLDELRIFAKARGVEILLENIPNGMSTAERLLYLLSETHLDLGFCFDTGHANLMGGVAANYRLMQDRIRSTHIHDNNGEKDSHLFPFRAAGGTIDWTSTIRLLRGRPEQYPLLLELKEDASIEAPLAAARSILTQFEAIPDSHEA